MKNLKLKASLLCCMLLVLLFSGCQKSDDLKIEKPSSLMKISEGRIAFPDIGSFELFISQNSTPELVQRQISSILAVSSIEDEKDKSFRSLANGLSEEGFLKSTMTTSPDTLRELVPDPQFEALLNSKGEVVVGETIYKVTPWGTFVTDNDHYKELESILINAGTAPTLSEKLKGHKFYSNQIQDDVYEITTSIALVDTYGRNRPDEFPIVKIADNKLKAAGDPKFNDVNTVTVDAKTIVGSWIGSLIGRDQSYGRYFNSRRRVKTTYYALNFGLYYTVGCSVKMQKKNWIGWSGTRSEKLALGWDFVNITYTFKGIDLLPRSSNNPPLSNVKKVTFSNTGVEYDLIDLTGLNLGVFNFDNFINDQLNKGIYSIPVTLYDYLKTRFNLPSLNVEKSVIAYNPELNKLKMIFGPHEEITSNQESMSKVFDRGGVGSLTLSGGKIIIKPSDLMKVSIGPGSIYGIAQYDGKWMGTRVVSFKSY